MSHDHQVYKRLQKGLMVQVNTNSTDHQDHIGIGMIIMLQHSKSDGICVNKHRSCALRCSSLSFL